MGRTLRNLALRVLTAISVTLVASACEETRRSAPTSPSTPVVPPAPSAVTVSGVVYEATAGGLRPLAGVGIDVSPDYQSHLPQVTSNADGRYEVTLGAGSSMMVKVVGDRAGYTQACRVTSPVSVSTTRDLYLVSDATLLDTGVPGSMPVAPQTLSGVVFERTPEGERPVPGARVIGDFSGGLGWGPSASTVTDAQGRYLLCGIGESELGLYLYVVKAGYQREYFSVDRRSGGSIDLNRGGNLDIELKKE